MNYSSLCIALGIQGTMSGVEFRARCPLHQDSHPSFSVNVENGLWMCHSRCGGGDFTQLVEKVLLCSYQEAKEWIASNGQVTSVDKLSKQLGKELIPVSTNPVPKELGWRSYYDSLTSRAMPEWFLDRGFTWQTIWVWDIRYDLAQDAVVIPVKWQGAVKGIIVRPFKPAPNTPKYWNSPDLPRSNLFFGEILSDRNTIIICEGVLDALWLWQNGYNAVSLLGSSISQEQVNILRSYRFGEVVLALDNDQAGKEGTKEITNRLLKGGWLLPQIKFIVFPADKKDPQDCSPQELAALYNNRKERQWNPL